MMPISASSTRVIASATTAAAATMTAHHTVTAAATSHRRQRTTSQSSLSSLASQTRSLHSHHAHHHPLLPSRQLQQSRLSTTSRSLFLSSAKYPPSTTSSSSSTSSSSASASSSAPSSISSSLRRDSDAGTTPPRPRRSLLYVPGSSEKMIKSSQKTDADCIIFDLEDSVAPHRKGAARETVLHGLNAAPSTGTELAVRINPPSGDVNLASDDLDVILPSLALQTIVLPKVESAEDILLVLDKLAVLRPEGAPPIALILSVESAAALHNMPAIITTVQQRITELTTHLESSSSAPPSGSSSPAPAGAAQPLAYLSALLFASEDFCAATSIIRTRSRLSLLVPRAQVVLTARAFGLEAIDMVCIDIKDEANLLAEATEAKELGFDAKQVVHPAQVGVVQRVFAPSEAEVRQAARVRFFYERGVAAHRGAVALPDEADPGGSATMIDAPMIRQADNVLAKARAAGVRVPDIGAEERAKGAGAGVDGAGSSAGSEEKGKGKEGVANGGKR
ncbi:hypothetical protein V8E36_007411 [Tilletia maclaganii]